MTQTNVYAITGGSGGMGIATAKRLAGKGTLLLADMSADRLASVKTELESVGATVQTLVCDVTKKDDVQALADMAKNLGRLAAVIHTAGLSPALAPADKIMEVNVVGTALILDAFLEIAEKGSVALCVASMAGHLAPVNEEVDKIMDHPLDENFMNTILQIIKDDRGASYTLSKRAVLRMVEQRVRDWGKKGARIVSISPGLITTPMGAAESKDPETDRQMRELNPLGRYGEPDEIAALITLLCSSEASYITGTDVRIDGGETPVLQGKVKS